MSCIINTVSSADYRKYLFHFWLYQGLNTICSVIDMLIFLSHLDFPCQTEAREAAAKLARPPLHSLHGDLAWGGRKGSEKAALFSLMLYLNTQPSFLSLIKRFGLPWCPQWGQTDQLSKEPVWHTQLEVLPHSPQRGDSLLLLKPLQVGCDSCSEGIRMLF